MRISDNKLLRKGLEELQQRLPSDWTVELTESSRNVSRETDGYVHIVSPDRRVARMAVEVKSRLEPRGVILLAAQVSDFTEPCLVVAPYLSPMARGRLRDANLSFLDLTGNVHLEVREPGLFIHTQGADIDPDKKARPSRSLRGAKAGRIVRSLLESRVPPRVRDLAERAGVDPGYVSRVLTLLDQEALIERRGHGRIVSVDWSRLLLRWAEDAPLASRGTQASFLEPRGLQTLQSKLERLDQRYAVTGTLAAARLAPLAPPRLAMLYVEHADRAKKDLGLRPAEAGANVLLIEPSDVGVFEGAVEHDGVRFVATSQVAADLLTSPGRGPAEAQELMEWMRKNEEVWRG